MSHLVDLTRRLHKEIPLSKHMGLEVTEASVLKLTLRAPLKPNSNHNGTAFGGSIYSAAVLACWTLVNESLKARKAENDYIVIQDGEMEYLHPVEDEFTAVAKWKDKASAEKFATSIDRKKLGRAESEAEVFCRGKVCARFKGRFVAQLKG